jgi:AIR synthase-related protein
MRVLDALAEQFRQSRNIAAKQDIGAIARRLGLAAQAIAVGDDCAAIPDGDGYLLFSIEGFMNEFVARDPWFAGWCGVMVNLSDIAAMGGRPIAVVDAIWADGEANALPVLDGLRAASEAFGVPIVGGHTNIRTAQSQLSVAVLGRAKALLSSFDAKPGQRLIAAIDHRGAYREPFSNWNAATTAPKDRQRADLDLLPQIAEAGLSRVGKDISQGGIIGTAIMLAECSGVGIDIDIDAVPVPACIALARWLESFPGFGFLLAVDPEHVDSVIARFAGRAISAADIGAITPSSAVAICSGNERRVIFDHAGTPLLDLAKPGRPA